MASAAPAWNPASLSVPVASSRAQPGSGGERTKTSLRQVFAWYEPWRADHVAALLATKIG